MIQDPTGLGSAAIKAVESGNPIVVAGLCGLAAIGLATLIVTMMKRRDDADRKAAASREAAFQKYLESTAESTREIAKNSAVQASLLGDIKLGTQDTVRHLQGWGDRDWLSDGLDEIKKGITILLAERRARSRSDEVPEGT